MATYYIQSGTGAKLTAEQIAKKTFPAGTFFVESGTGEQLTKEQLLAPTTNKDLDSIVSNPNLSKDQQAMVRSIYDAVSNNDTEMVSRLRSAMEAAGEFSDPYFKAQIRLATDALERGTSSREGDLRYQEGSLRRALDELKKNTSASKEYLSFQHAKELKDLQTRYEQNLESTQNNLAATGFTSSSRRARAEQLLKDENEGLVESSNKRFGYQVGNLDRTLSFSSANTAAQIENYRRLASEGKLDLLRSSEEQVGSETLSDLGYKNLLGGVGGTIPRAQAIDKFQFASNFVF